MSTFGYRTTFATRVLAVSLMGLLAVTAAFSADKKPSAPAPKPAAAPHPSGGGGASHGASTASHGPTTASHGPTTASHGPTTASHGATTTTSHTTTTSTAGHTTTAAGHTTTATHTTSTTTHTTSTTATHGTTAGGARPGGATAGGRGTTGGAHQQVAKGQTVHQTKSGGSVTKRADGKVASLHDPKRGMDVHHSLSGTRHVSVERADHSRVVVDGRGRGYVQRPYSFHGHEYGRRSYYYGGHYYHAYYGRYYYRGVWVNPYYPAYYYQPAFYGWAYNPWVTPMPYAWGWGGNPWFGFYAGWYTPWPVYAGPAFWLTDYLIAQQLQAAYAAQAAANAAAMSNAAPLTPDVKQLIADEVKRQIALENAEASAAQQNAEPNNASSSIQRDLTDGVQHVYVAGADLDVVDAGGNECALSQGDAIQLGGQNAPDATAVNMAVLASKGGRECPKGDTVSVNITDLQEMKNSMRQTIDQGMQDLQKKQGTGGLPAAPPSAQGAPQEAPVAIAAPPPPPESEVTAELNGQSKAADQAEQEAAADAGGTPAEPPTVALGQTPDQVIAALGQPKSIMDLGAKKIYVYKDSKVIFRDGKVADIQ
jgi:hypothetical protein